ncbi:MAG TPA: hypothetical protein VMV29_15090 [Ktedonobacterales bacterium]|nr:hypothetical protein [Ktedonobacterales bacterium]
MATQPAQATWSQHVPHHNGQVYVIRGDERGESEEHALASGFCSIGWHDCPFPLPASQEELETVGATVGWGPHAARQIWVFAHEPELDHAVIVMPRYGQDTVALGICASTMYCSTQATKTNPDPALRRNVIWLHDGVQRATFSAATRDIFNSLRHTISKVQRGDVADELVAAADVLLAESRGAFAADNK